MSSVLQSPGGKPVRPERELSNPRTSDGDGHAKAETGKFPGS